MHFWNRFHDMLAPLESDGLLRRSIMPGECQHDAHMYYVALSNARTKQAILGAFRNANISAVFHHVPQHTSPAGRRFGHAADELPDTIEHAERLVQPPLWVGLSAAQQDRVVETLAAAIRH